MPFAGQAFAFTDGGVDLDRLPGPVLSFFFSARANSLSETAGLGAASFGHGAPFFTRTFQIFERRSPAASSSEAFESPVI